MAAAHNGHEQSAVSELQPSKSQEIVSLHLGAVKCAIYTTASEGRGRENEVRVVSVDRVARDGRISGHTHLVQ